MIKLSSAYLRTYWKNISSSCSECKIHFQMEMCITCFKLYHFRSRYSWISYSWAMIEWPQNDSCHSGLKYTCPRRSDHVSGWTPPPDCSFEESGSPHGSWLLPWVGMLLDHSSSCSNGTFSVPSFYGFNWSGSGLGPLARYVRLDGPPAGALGPLPN